MSKCKNGNSEFISQKSICTVTLFKAKDVEMVYILESDFGTRQLTFKTGKSTNKAPQDFFFFCVSRGIFPKLLDYKNSKNNRENNSLYGHNLFRKF